MRRVARERRPGGCIVLRDVRFRSLTLDDLHIEDERSVRHVGLYEQLKRALVRDGYRFRVLDGASWDRALFLNLTFWDPGAQGDVLYAVKANPAPEILDLLARLGACFDCASAPEIEQALAAGATLGNDVTALRGDPAMAAVVAGSGARWGGAEPRGSTRGSAGEGAWAQGSAAAGGRAGLAGSDGRRRARRPRGR